MQKSFFFEIAVASASAKRQAIFTYSSVERCKKGRVVVVKFRSKKVSGVVLRKVDKPKFMTKPITEVTDIELPNALLVTMLWAIDYYPFDKGAVVRLFLPPSKPSKIPSTELPAAKYNNTALPLLSSDQRKALEVVKGNSGKTVFLHGDTGTGKTLVYIEIIRECLIRGQSVLLLVPEITLGEQLGIMVSKYIDNVITYNSLQAESTRRNIWYGLYRSKLPQVVIGPRSSLFLPLPNIGMIIIDEAHDTSYKQQQAPYYSTLHIAGNLAKNSDAGLVYGSATPNATDYKIAVDKGYPVIRLKERPIAIASQLGSSFSVVNTKDRRLFSKNRTLSDDAVRAIRKSVKNGKQALLLLNKRGTAHLIQCENCGWQHRCEACDHTLVYHKDRHLAICHYCDRSYPMPSTCPVDNGHLKLMSIGTKFVEEDCRQLFPETPVLRIDTDSVTRDTIREKIDIIRSGEVSIIVGTQLIAKGLDLPFLETIVVIDARRQSSDYLGDERFYQLLHQVIGRGVRGYQQTTIILQTPDISDPLIRWATTEDWESFFRQEIRDRAKFNYPPSTHLAVYRIKRKTAKGLDSVIHEVRSNLSSRGLQAEIIGPMPSFQGMGRMEWQIIAKARKRGHLIEIGELLGSSWTTDLDALST